ncbi:MAG TPA: family 43 glycosylhydrolase [Polyangiaceae bacterium]|nr:family 43 glycosylhydrolase [Polyangiaceae bacterium]
MQLVSWFRTAVSRAVISRTAISRTVVSRTAISLAVGGALMSACGPAAETPDDGQGTGGTGLPGVGGTGGDPGTSTGGALGGQTSQSGGAAGCSGPTPGTQGQNPLIPSLFTADPAALVHDCTFYITAGRDQGTTGFDLREWYVLSSTDLVNWSDNGGPVMGLDTFEWASANAWAGQMVERNGKFYWYVPVNEAGGGMAIGVAVADSPLGPFVDAIGEPLVNDAIEMEEFGYSDAGQTAYTIDPTVFVDDDGQAYLLYGGFWRLVIVPLAEDMVSFSGEMFERTPPGFFEAPYLTKRNGTYYLAYAAGSNPATIDYVTATSPTGPWQNRGRILDVLPKLEGQDEPTSHPAIAEFQGEWYLVYHVSNGPGGGTYRRQVAMDKLTFAADGSIEKVSPSGGLSF